MGLFKHYHEVRRKSFFCLTAVFILVTAIGTLLHEAGHYCAAKYFGLNAKINYAHTYYWTVNANDIIAPEQSFYVLLGGPLQTMLTGTLGLVLLFLFRKSFQSANNLSFGQWTIIFVSLFWLRQPANFFAWVSKYIFKENFSSGCDEILLARYLQLPEWLILTLTAAIGVIVLAAVIFKFIPLKYRLTFILSGFTGGIIGYVVWLILLGEYIM
jgi:hypothetical protein